MTATIPVPLAISQVCGIIHNGQGTTLHRMSQGSLDHDLIESGIVECGPFPWHQGECSHKRYQQVRGWLESVR